MKNRRLGFGGLRRIKYLCPYRSWSGFFCNPNMMNPMETEKQKAAAGLLYDANHDATLLRERMDCAVLLHDFNHLSPADEGGRLALLHRLLGRMGERSIILSPFQCDYGYNIEMGDDTFVNVGCVMLDGARIWVCSVCGFTFVGERPPALCPVCKVPDWKFDEIRGRAA